MRSLSLLIVILFAGGCASVGAHKIQSLELALTQGREAVEKLCVEQKMSGACALNGHPVKNFHTLPILQGVSSATQARLVVLAPKRRDLKYFLLHKDSVKSVVPEEIVTGPDLDQQLEHLEIFNLTLGQDYKLIVIGPNAELWDQRTFRALDLNKKRARFALVSCMDDALSDVQKKIWPELLSQNLDAVIFAGDNTYADWAGGKAKPVTNEEQLWSRYAETRSALEFFKSEILVPVVATWDDHDFGKNDGDRTFAFKERALSAFYGFFPQRKAGVQFERGPGVASWWKAFGVQFALLDDRSFRSPNKLDSEDQTHFGPDQESWLKEGLAAAKVPVFVVSGDQFFGGYHGFESYEGSHPKSFNTQVARWRKSTTVPLLFLSGDRHLTEIIKVPKTHLGYPTFEITSSAIHAKVFKEAFEKSPSPNQLVGKAGEYNYTVIEITEASARALKLDVKSFGVGKKLIYEQNLTVKR